MGNTNKTLKNKQQEEDKKEHKITIAFLWGNRVGKTSLLQ